MMKILLSKTLYLCAFLWYNFGISQNNTYWQQQADYKMIIDMNVETFQYKGNQHLTYTNNSPDTLTLNFFFPSLERTGSLSVTFLP